MNSSKTLTNKESWIASAIASGDIVTPCLVLDLDAVDSALGLFAQHLAGVDLYYSVKANDDPQLLSHLASRGVGFDVASINEIRKTTDAGAKPSNLILSHTIKSPNTIREIFRRRIAATTVDNEQDLKALALESTFHTFRPNIFARIKVLPMGVDINLNEKFGCSPETAVELLAKAHDLGLPAAGVHFHVGTQCKNEESYRIGIETAIDVLSAASKLTGSTMNVINIGGGFPDEIAADECGGLEKFFIALGSILHLVQKAGYNIVAEPGRVIASNAGIAVSQVIGRNTHEDRDWIYLDDGIYGLYSTAYYEKRRFEFETIGLPKADLESFVVAGPTCDSLDVIGTDILLPSSIKVGDYVYASNAGAYSISVKSNFNGMGQISTAVSEHAVVAPEAATVRQAIAGA